jgi:hypothetical protein
MRIVDLDLMETLDLVEYIKDRLGIHDPITAISIHYVRGEATLIYCNRYPELDNQLNLL